MTAFNFTQLRLPVIQAPMAGGINNPALAAAVANAGGVGSFGFAYSTPQKISEDLAATKSITAGPINANFFVFQTVDLPSDTEQQAALAALRAVAPDRDLVLKVPEAPFFPNLPDQLAPVWHHRPAIVTFHLGIPGPEIVAKAKSLGICVGMTATSIHEAVLVEQAGADFVVAQGIEAGGHRGIFDPDGSDQNLSVDDLLAELVQHIRLPLVAAGAVMTGADIAAKLARGATAVQMGSAFLCVDESGASAAHKDLILRQPKRAVAYTRAFSGRRAQGIDNEFIRRMQDQPYLPFPIQNTATGPIRQWAARESDGEYQSLWVGQAYQKARATSAAQLMQSLGEELAISRVA